MTIQDTIDSDRIRKAIGYIQEHYRSQPDLDEVAAQVSLSPFHFQRLFTEWAGVSPKRFLQYISLTRAKELLQESASLFDTAHAVGLSGTGRLHDLFIRLEGMTPGEYKNGGENLSIRYLFADSPFGRVLAASTPKGICRLAFADRQEEALRELKELFPRARYSTGPDAILQNALSVFSRDWSELPEIKLHVKGTAFQLKVWEALLSIPAGKLTTYGRIARGVNSPKACRAVGTAVGENPVAFLIPCHRVIRSSGILGQYRYGSARKTAIIGWEGARTDDQSVTSLRDE